MTRDGSRAFADPEDFDLGKVSDLGGHRYSTDAPSSGSRDSQGSRLFPDDPNRCGNSNGSGCDYRSGTLDPASDCAGPTQAPARTTGASTAAVAGVGPDAVPPYALLALVLFAWRRRR